MKAELKRVTEERDFLKRAAACFVKQPGWGTRSSISLMNFQILVKCFIG